jgi:hypothetical protein
MRLFSDIEGGIGLILRFLKAGVCYFFYFLMCVYIYIYIYIYEIVLWWWKSQSQDFDTWLFHPFWIWKTRYLCVGMNECAPYYLQNGWMDFVHIQYWKVRTQFMWGRPFKEHCIPSLKMPIFGILRTSSVSIGMSYRLDDWGLIPGKGKGFFSSPQCPDWPPILLSNGYQGIFPQG